MNTTLNTKTESRRSGGIVAGAILILVGLMNLAQFIPGFNIGLFFLPVLGACFLAAGLITRKVGLLIPGGIVMGVGAGALLTMGLLPTASEMVSGGAFFFGLAGGFSLITLASLFIGRRMAWPLIPAAGLTAFGAILFTGETGLALLTSLRFVWPLVLIAIGLYLVLRRK